MPLGSLVEVIDLGGVGGPGRDDRLVTECVQQQLGAPGFLSGQHWVGRDEPAVSLALYDLDDLAVLESDDANAASGGNRSTWPQELVGSSQMYERYEAEQTTPGGLIAPEGAGGLYLIGMNVDEDHKDEFGEWYEVEHLPALAAVPGVVAARRYRSHVGPRRYFATYHLEDPSIQGSPDWLAAANTPWTERMRAVMRDRYRLVCVPYEDEP